MTNNDELAMKLKQTAQLVHDNEQISNYGKLEAWKVRFRHTACPANILALLAERDADKKLIAELDQRVLDYAGIATARAHHVFNLEKRIAELEGGTVTHDVGVMNIGNPYCEDHLVAWTVTGRQLAAGIYYLDARRVGDIKLEVGE